jgi:L-histidine Nalpha-methyltransferase
MLLCCDNRHLPGTEVDPAFRDDVLKGLSLRPAATELAEIIGPGRVIVEFGSGSSAKTRILLSALNASAYVPIDISIDFLWESVAAAVDLLRTMAATLGAGSMLLVGIDCVKDVHMLPRAYDDAQGVTALFNINLVHRVNRELRCSVPVDAFNHVARWNDPEARIEMHLEASCGVHFVVGGRRFWMMKGETIHTENSLKYGAREASALLLAGGWTPIADWMDEKGHFLVILAKEGVAQSAA